jgi:hypothetical protein
MEITMKTRLIIAAALLSLVGACVAGPYDGRPAYYNGGYNGGYNSGYNSGYYRNSGYDRTYYNGRYENDGYNRTYYNGRTYQ